MFEQDLGDEEASRVTAGAPCREVYQADARLEQACIWCPSVPGTGGTVRECGEGQGQPGSKEPDGGPEGCTKLVWPEWRSPELTHWILNAGRATVSVCIILVLKGKS